MSCTECGEAFLPAEVDDIACDGCHKFFHRRHLNYILIDVEWDDQPKAYAFCRECDDES